MISPVNFQKLYISVRKKENRIYSIDEIRKLPDVKSSDPLYKEWIIRKNTAEKFAAYIRSKPSLGAILEIGCGNGWFSNYLASQTRATSIIGLDINEFELQQAKEAFTDPKLKWLCADIFEHDLPRDHFDIIVFNSSVQYFPDLQKLIIRVSELLKINGEIHFLDSPFYKNEDEKSSAKSRSEKYYSGLGFPEMAVYYTPHLYAELKRCNYTVKEVDSFQKKIRAAFSGKRASPFPWIRILKK